MIRHNTRLVSRTRKDWSLSPQELDARGFEYGTFCAIFRQVFAGSGHGAGVDVTGARAGEIVYDGKEAQTTVK